MNFMNPLNGVSIPLLMRLSKTMVSPKTSFKKLICDF